MSWCGPPRSFTYASTWPWLGHSVSGLIRSTYRPIQARFHYGSAKWLNLALQINSLDRSTKSTPSPNKSAPTPCMHAISGLFHSPPGVLFTFPSLYLFTIDHVMYLALAGGPAGFNQGFTCPGLLEKTNIRSASLSLTRLSLPLVNLSRLFC